MLQEAELPVYKCELVLGDDQFVTIGYTGEMPNWWRRFWYWALLGWYWRKL